MKTETYDIGDTVICDLCGTDFSEGTEAQDEKGGYIFGSNGVCPRCAQEFYSRIREHNEQGHIKALCPSDKTFLEFIIDARGGNNTVEIRTADKDEDIGKLLA